jgi:GABA permease
MHNPLRNEAEVFRAVVIVGIGAALVIALALLTGGPVGAIVFFVLVGSGAAYLWRRAQGTETTQTPVASTEPDTHRILVIANETVAGRDLLEEIRTRGKGKRAEVLVVTPALTKSQLQHWASDTDDAKRAAEHRLEDSLATLREAGLDARGGVGDEDPNVALGDALREFGADEVIISTHPPDRSRWLERGVVIKAREEVPLPVTHVVVDLEAEGVAGR